MSNIPTEEKLNEFKNTLKKLRALELEHKITAPIYPKNSWKEKAVHAEKERREKEGKTKLMEQDISISEKANKIAEAANKISKSANFHSKCAMAISGLALLVAIGIAIFK